MNVFIDSPLSKKGGKVGDNLVHLSTIPENYFLQYNKKLLDIDRPWFYDYNPYVIRDDSILEFIKIDLIKEYYDYINKNGEQILYSPTMKFAAPLKIKPKLIYPRLYRYEDNQTEEKTLCIHIHPGDYHGRRDIPDNVLNVIKNKYKDWRIIQIGGNDNKTLDFAENRLGSTLWEMAEIISKCERYIGISSGPFHIAEAYPKVEKRILIFNNEDELIRLRPCSNTSGGDDWLYYSSKYYNLYERDIGITKSYLKI